MKRKRVPIVLTIQCCLFMTLVLIVSFFTQNVEAQLYPGPISSALGESGIANIDVIEGPFQNPAILPHLKNEFSWGLVSGQGSVIDQRDDRYWGAQLVDCSSDKYFPAALGYVSGKTTFGTNPEADEKYFTLSGGKILLPHLSFGLALSRRESEIPAQDKMVQNNYFLGALYTPSPNFALGLVFRNLAHPDGSIPAYLHLDSLIGVGFYYIYLERFHFRGDIINEIENNPKNKKSLSLGAESRISDYLAVRLGYRKDDLNDLNIFTAGLGFLGPKLSLSYGFETETQKSASGRHVVDLRMPF